MIYRSWLAYLMAAMLGYTVINDNGTTATVVPKTTCSASDCTSPK